MSVISSSMYIIEFNSDEVSIKGAWFVELFPVVVFCPSASGVIVSPVIPKHPVRNSRQAIVITFSVRVNCMILVFTESN